MRCTTKTFKETIMNIQDTSKALIDTVAGIMLGQKVESTEASVKSTPIESPEPVALDEEVAEESVDLEEAVESVDLEEAKDVLTVKFGNGKKQGFSKADIDEILNDMDMYMSADNIPKWINQSRAAVGQSVKKKKDMIVILKDILKGNYNFLDLSTRKGLVKESVDLEEAKLSDFVEQGITSIDTLNRLLKSNGTLQQDLEKAAGKKYTAEFKKMQTAIASINDIYSGIITDIG